VDKHHQGENQKVIRKTGFAGKTLTGDNNWQLQCSLLIIS